jgi:hypothetical protein
MIDMRFDYCYGGMAAHTPDTTAKAALLSGS